MPLSTAKVEEDNYTTTELRESCSGCIILSYCCTHVCVKSVWAKFMLPEQNLYVLSSLNSVVGESLSLPERDRKEKLLLAGTHDEINSCSLSSSYW